MKKIISLIVATALCISFCACSNTSSDSDSVASNIESVSENFLFSDMNWDSSEESVSQKSSESKILDDNATTRYTLPDVQLYDANGISYYFFNDSKMVRAVFKSTDSNVDSCAELISEEFDKNEAYSLSDNSQSQYSKTWLSNDTKVTLFNTLGVLTLAYFPIDADENADLILNESSSASESTKAQNGDFRSANWGDTIEKVKASETAEYLGVSTNEAGTMMVYEGKVADYNANIVYYFDTNGNLYQGVYDLTDSYNQGSMYITIYNSLKDALASKYGSPATDNVVKQSHLADRTDEGNALVLGYTTYATRWNADNQTIYLGMSSINYDVFITIQYIDPNHEEVKNTSGL